MNEEERGALKKTGKNMKFPKKIINKSVKFLKIIHHNGKSCIQQLTKYVLLAKYIKTKKCPLCSKMVPVMFQD